MAIDILLHNSIITLSCLENVFKTFLASIETLAHEKEMGIFDGAFFTINISM